MTVENKNLEHLRDYAWKYFQYHASQRLTTFHFYILISSLISTGYYFAVKNLPVLAIIFGILLIILSFVFWKLDSRNRQLIKYSAEALEYIESKDRFDETENKPHVLNVFTRDLVETTKLHETKTRWSWKKPMHYSTCFNIIFVSFGVIGLAGIIYAIINLFWTNM